MGNIIEIRPISGNEWLPDRCMSLQTLVDPKKSSRKAGCASLTGYYTKDKRERLERLYQTVLHNVGCCGFVAWDDGLVVGYNNFFPREVAQTTGLYGWGNKHDLFQGSLVHHCISLINHPNYRRKGIGTNLIRHTLDWAKENGWLRFEVHLVLPDTPLGYEQEQKSCAGFWHRFGFKITYTTPADPETKALYGVAERYSMVLDIDEWQGFI